MMKTLCILILALFSVCCRTVPKPSAVSTRANLEALEQTVDLENGTIETDEVLQFERPVSDLGKVPLGESREVTVLARNRTSKPLVLLSVSTSCQCTEVIWERKPVPPGEACVFRIRFTAEQPGTFFKKIAVRHSAGTRPVTCAVSGVAIPKENH